MAPSASVVVYEAPDARDTSLLFTWHEAIFDARAQIISNSYSSREDSEARVVRRVYDEGGLEAAAFGLTLVASGGDEGKPDIPAASPYVTSIGGTALSFNGDSGTDFTEVAWDDSGSGITTFARPSWQAQVVTGSYRVTSDFSVDGGPGYWLNYLGKWTGAYGTSLSSPIVAGILADVQAARTKAGKPSMGYLNPILYTVTAAQQSFRDITSGGTKDFQAGVGWDAPTGWGVIRAKQLAEALP
jgi:kumamolisin